MSRMQKPNSSPRQSAWTPHFCISWKPPTLFRSLQGIRRRWWNSASLTRCWQTRRHIRCHRPSNQSDLHPFLSYRNIRLFTTSSLWLTICIVCPACTFSEGNTRLRHIPGHVFVVLSLKPVFTHMFHRSSNAQWIQLPEARTEPQTPSDCILRLYLAFGVQGVFR